MVDMYKLNVDAAVSAQGLCSLNGVQESSTWFCIVCFDAVVTRCRLVFFTVQVRNVAALDRLEGRGSRLRHVAQQKEITREDSYIVQICDSGEAAER